MASFVIALSDKSNPQKIAAYADSTGLSTDANRAQVFMDLDEAVLRLNELRAKYPQSAKWLFVRSEL
jgi:hypothetical protein